MQFFQNTQNQLAEGLRKGRGYVLKPRVPAANCNPQISNKSKKEIKKKTSRLLACDISGNLAITESSSCSMVKVLAIGREVGPENGGKVVVVAHIHSRVPKDDDGRD